MTVPAGCRGRRLMTLALRYAVRSDRGLMRTNNEDSVYAGPRLLALADGMGGHAAGEVASNVVISALAHLDEDRPVDDLISTLRDATADANNHLRDLVTQDPNLDGMGTTLTALLFAGHRVGLVHVGDSRAYLVRGGQLTQITHDDTFVQALIDEGRLTEEEASSHPQRSLILHALNGADVEPDLSIREVRVGDRYLLCSDGLSDVVSPDTLLEALQLPDPHESADRLVELALRAGGPDNVTCIVADVIDVPYADDAPVMDGAVGGNRPQREPGPTSPASRAATLNAPPGADRHRPARAGAAAPAPAAVRRRLAARARPARRGRVRAVAVDPGAVLRRRGGRAGRGLPRHQHRAGPGAPLLGGGHQPDAAGRPDAGGPPAGAGRHPGRQPGRGRPDPGQPQRPAEAAVPDRGPDADPDAVADRPGRRPAAPRRRRPRRPPHHLADARPGRRGVPAP